MEVVQHAASPVVNTGDFSLKVFISHVFPRSIAEAMANNEILQIVVFSLFFGFALAGVKRAGYTTIVDGIEELAKVMFKVTDFVMAFAPIGVFAAIASAITTQGLGLIVDYGKLIAEFYLGIVILVRVIRCRLSVPRPLGVYLGQADPRTCSVGILHCQQRVRVSENHGGTGEIWCAETRIQLRSTVGVLIQP